MRDNAAYDFSQFAPEKEVRAPRVTVVKSDEEKKLNKRLRQQKRRCFVFGLILLMLVIVTVYSHTKLDETTTAIEKRTNALTQLQSENAYLNYQLENLVSLKNAEDYAKNELGLIKMSGSQIEYINLQHENIIEKNDNNTGFMPFIKHLFSSVAERFD